jgi:hypothetical protein
MKKLVLTVFALGVFSFYASAQLSGGLKAGLNLADVGGDAEGDIRPSFHAGAYVNFAFSEQLSLQPELLYNSVGAKEDDDALKLDYISIPVMVLYSFGNFNVQAGPQIGFLASAKIEDEDIKDFYKSTDFGFNVGVGANFNKLNASVRYSIGLSNVVDSDDFDATNNVIQLSVGYRLFGGE